MLIGTATYPRPDAVSVTAGYATRELRRRDLVDPDGTIRRAQRPARTNANRAAIAESLGGAR